MIDADKLDEFERRMNSHRSAIGWLVLGPSHAAELIATAREALTLHAALVEARDDVESWASYASQYFREKHDLAGELAKLDAVIAASQPPAEGAK